MNQQLIAFGVFLLIVGIVSIASSSIGISCYNNCSDQKEKHKSNFNFVLNLILAILLTLGSVGFMYQATKVSGLSFLGI